MSHMSAPRSDNAIYLYHLLFVTLNTIIGNRNLDSILHFILFSSETIKGLACQFISHNATSHLPELFIRRMRHDMHVTPLFRDVTEIKEISSLYQ